MLLQSSFLKTKKFFQKTLHNFKFLVLGGYQKLPKTPHNINQNCGGYDGNEVETVKGKGKDMLKEEKVYQGSFVNSLNQTGYSKIKRQETSDDGRKSETMRSEHSGYYLVAKKLKELEMMDMSDIEHELDIEEVIHYYSRLTCPVYLEIFDKFFMQMYPEFFHVHKSQ